MHFNQLAKISPKRWETISSCFVISLIGWTLYNQKPSTHGSQDSGLVRSASTNSSSCLASGQSSFSFLIRSSSSRDRTVPLTRYPSSWSCFTMWVAMNPPAPVTSTTVERKIKYRDTLPYIVG